MRKALCTSLALLLALGVVVLESDSAWAQGRFKSRPITLTPRVVDAICLLPAGLVGESHRECAIGWDKAGVRMYLLDEKANETYAVMADAVQGSERPAPGPSGARRDGEG